MVCTFVSSIALGLGLLALRTHLASDLYLEARPLGTFLILCAISAVVFVPLILVYALLVHGTLLLVGGSRTSMERTFQACCYSYGSFVVFAGIPVLGSLMNLLLVFHGGYSLSKALGCALWQGIVAKLVPYLLGWVVTAFVIFQVYRAG